MSFYTCVIINPASQNGATGKYWPELRAALDRVLDRWDHEFTLEPGDGVRLATQAAERDYEMIVAVGGDGTMNEVVTGLFRCEEDGKEPRLIRDDLVLGGVRAGTGGDFARLFELSHRLPDSVAHLSGDQTQACDLAWVEYVDHSGKPAGRAFVNIASFGLSGLVVDKVNKSTKAFGGRASFFAGTLRALARYKPMPVNIMVDGQNFLKENMMTTAVANGQFFGGGMHIAPEAQTDDGIFDVVTQLRNGPKEILNVGDLYAGRAHLWPSVRTTRGSVIEAFPINPQDRVLLDVDGEQPGTLPAVFRMFKHAVRWKR